MRLGGVFLFGAVILAALAAAGEISLNGVLTGWESFVAQIAAHR